MLKNRVRWQEILEQDLIQLPMIGEIL